ncbi:MAG: TlpA family protein disulfide reductase [Caulobacteraceae bacterium]|nr:TlpA family protein disulfide reductase [Caulobacteraceae bacterium]
MGRRKLRRRLLGALGAAGFVAVAGPGLAARPVVGEPAPPFELTGLDGRKLRLSELKGLVAVLSFWASWCGPCREELPLLADYARRQGGDRLAILPVNMDGWGVPDSSRRAPGISGTSFRSLRGPYGLLGGMPTNYVIGADGVLRYARGGAFTWPTLDALLAPLLLETPPATARAKVANAGRGSPLGPT